MPETPAASNHATPPAASAEAAGPADGRRRTLVALLAIAAGLGAVGALVAVLAEPGLAPLLALLAVLAGAGALWAGARAERDRLAAENAGLALRLEALSDAAWELHESEERYRSLLEARRRAEAANRAKSGFLAAVSHEFRTPLNGILGLTGLLLESNLSADQQTYARAVRSSGEALLTLVDDMLDFSRIEAGRLDLRPEPTDIAAMLQEIGELLGPRAHVKAIELAVDPAADLPSRVLVDPARLRQVLINLVGNGVKFTDAGGVALRAAPAGGRIVFAVEDSGPGIDPAEAERIFGEFEQIDTALNRRHGGAGLGLAISRRIVRAMGGDIAVTPREGGGSVFSFALDLAAVEGARPPAAPDLAGRSLMVLAPDGAEAAVIVAALRAAGAEARPVHDVVEAAALAGAASAAALPYDAVLIDHRVPPEPAAVLSRLRAAAGVRLAAAVMTEPGRRGALDALREAGFDAYLVRPVRRSSLVRIVAEIVAGAGGFRADPEDLRVRAGGAPTPTGGRLEVLLAEDNEINALLVRAVLEGLGHRVSEVRDGAAAVEAVTAGKRRFAAILLDLHMPGLDGIAAARAIRDFEARSGASRAAILALTADVLAETRAAAAAAGIDAVLEKPVAPERLRAMLAEMTGQPAGSSAA